MHRIGSIDIFKIVVAYCVIFFHTLMQCWSLMIEDSTLTTSISEETIMYVVMVSKPLFQWLMPSLFLISGHFILREDNFSDIKKYYRYKVLPIAYATIITLILYFVLYLSKGKIMLYWHDLSLNSLGLNNMWYIYNMLLMYALAPYIYAAIKKLSIRKLTLYILVLYVVLLIVEAISYNEIICIILRTTMYLMAFTSGYMLGDMISYFEKKVKITTSIIIIILLFALIYFVTYYFIVIRQDYESTFFYLFANTHPHSIFAVLPAVLITPLLFKININIYIKNVSLTVLITYLIHPFVIDFFARYMTYQNLGSIVINATIHFVVSYVLAYIVTLLIIKVGIKKV